MNFLAQPFQKFILDMLLIINNLDSYNSKQGEMHPFNIQNLLGLPAEGFRAPSPASTIELSDDSRMPSPNPTIILSSDDEEEYEICDMEEVGKV